MTITVVPEKGSPYLAADTQNIHAWLGSFFVSGFTPSLVTNVVQLAGPGVAVIQGHGVAESSSTVNIPFVAGGTYVWIQITVDGSGQANGVDYVAQSATPSGLALKICSYTDNGTDVTSVTDLTNQPIPATTKIGTGFVDVPLRSILSSDVSSIDGTESTGLAISLKPNTTYAIKAHLWLYVSATNIPGLQVHALASGAELTYVNAIYGVQAPGNDSQNVMSAPNVGTGANFAACEAYATSAYFGAEILSGVITTGASATTFQIDIADTATTDKVKAGSWIEATPILTTTTSEETITQGLLFPLYIYPTSPASTTWGPLISIAEAYPTMSIIAVINPDNGPGTSVDSNYTAGISALQAVGITCVGYVNTCNPPGTLLSSGTIEGYIAEWKSLYPAITGIFFDNVYYNSGANDSFYESLVTYCGTEGYSFTIANPGENVTDSELSICNITVIYENTTIPTTADVDAYYPTYPVSELAWLVGNGGPTTLSGSNYTAIAAAQVYVKYLYVCSVYSAFPSYLDAFVAAIA